MLHDKAIAPVRGTKPKVGRKPVQPQRVDGEEIEPSVSEPMLKATHPAAVADAGPAEDPLEPCAGPYVAFRQRAQRELRHQHSAGGVQSLHDNRVLIDRLRLEAGRAPSSAI